MLLCAPSLLTPKLPNAEAPLNCQGKLCEEEAVFPGESDQPGLKKKMEPLGEGTW